MNKNIINEEIENYLNKYSRFLSKDIYITVKMYDDFLVKYKYLYKECEENSDDFKDNINYLKILKIKDKKLKFIKEHNKKYLRKHIKEEKDYFDNMYEKIELSVKDRELMLIMDNLTLDKVNSYQKTILFLSKVRYLIDKEKYKDKDLIIVIEDKKIYKDLSRLLRDYNISSPIYLYSNMVEEYCNSNKLKLISIKDKTKLLENYFKKEIFSNKEILRSYLTNFKYLYFNKDVYDYDTLNDYHNYMFMRKYIQSGTSNKDYITSLIDKKRRNLITINNEKVNYLEEVDIANYLYLNNIRYKIIKGDRNYFKINKLLFYYANSLEEEDDNCYFKLYSKYKSGTLLSHLKKLLKNNNIESFVMDKEVLKNKIKSDSSNIYYKDFIEKIVIPYIDTNAKDNKLLNDIKDYYLKYLESNNLIDGNIINKKFSRDKIYKSKYLIADNDYLDTSSVKLTIKN
jgi:hypothetical protein